jgi:hypothetical protein
LIPFQLWPPLGPFQEKAREREKERKREREIICRREEEEEESKQVDEVSGSR